MKRDYFIALENRPNDLPLELPEVIDQLALIEAVIEQIKWC